jgi:hypothetical protein
VLAEEASNIASTYSDVFTATILDEERCRELKMGSYLGVAAASANPPRFVHLCYKPPGGNIKRKLAIVGKGLTFDRSVPSPAYFSELIVTDDIGFNYLVIFSMLCLPQW